MEKLLVLSTFFFCHNVFKMRLQSGKRFKKGAENVNVIYFAGLSPMIAGADNGNSVTLKKYSRAGSQ